MPWTVIPDALSFQPTSATAVRVFQVRIERREHVDAVRRQEVRVRHMSVDFDGDSFCVIFWPDLGHIQPGLQLEVEISGLRGRLEVFSVFHEFTTLGTQDEALRAEASSLRALLQVVWASDAKELPLLQKNVEIEPLSHLDREITANSNDLVITLRSPAASLWGSLLVKRFDGEFTEVLRACHTMKLRDHIFLVRVKLPLPWHYYELKFSCSTDSPRDLQPASLRYFIHTTGKCQAIVRSLDDRMMEKYGFVNITMEAQLHGVTVIAPCKYRVCVGQIYFLAHVDRGVAMQAARDALPITVMDSKKGLFDERLLPPQDLSSPKEVRMMHEALQAGLSKNVQETCSEIHMDLLVNGHRRRLRERADLPCLFEGIVSISDIDASTKVELVLRFPKVHACDFTPRRVAEWIVSRAQDRVHESF